MAVTRDRVGLRPSSTATKRPSSSALLLGWLLLSLPPVSSVVCPSCKDTIPGCKGGADCPLLKTPLENAATLASGSTSKAPDLTQLLPPDLLCTFTKSVMETLSAVARAPKGGGSVDISPTSISSATDRRLLGCLPRPTGRWPLTVVSCRPQASPTLPPRQRLWLLGRCTGRSRGWHRTWSLTISLVHARGMAHEAFSPHSHWALDLRTIGSFPVVSRGLWVRCV